MESLKHTMQNTTKTSGFVTTSRIIASLQDEINPMDPILHSNIENETSNISESNENEINDEETDNMIHYTQNNNIDHSSTRETYDLTEIQLDMKKRYSHMSFTHSEEASLDLFLLLKKSNVPIVMFDRIVK